MRRADIEVPSTTVDVNSWVVSACYPQGSFCPLIDCLSIQHSRFTKPNFRSCSTCRSHSQARFCLCTLRMISNHSERTFGRLRYTLGGDRPSQTAHQTLSSTQIQGYKLDTKHRKGGIPTMAHPKPQSRVHSLPPILCIRCPISILSCSEAPWGLSV